MYTAHARVSTSRPDRYRKQLASHLGRRSEIVDDGDGTWIMLPIESGTARCHLVATSDALLLNAEADSAERLTQVRDVVGGHLERFGERDELTVAWQSAQNGQSPAS